MLTVPPDDTRQRIVTEASQLFRESGFGGFSMRKLASRLDLTATALYRHFEDKERLLASVCVEGFARFAQALWRALSETSPLHRLRRTGREYLWFALDNPNYYRIMFMTPVDLLGWEHVPEQNRQHMGGTFQFLVDRVAECQAHGDLEAGDARTLAAGIWAHCHGLVSLRLDGQLGELHDEAFTQFYVDSSDCYLRGLGAPVAALP